MNGLDTRSVQTTWNAVWQYLVWIMILMLVWEIAQLPLYTLWRTAGWRDQIVSVLHCTAGDIAIALTALIFSVLVTNRSWPATEKSSMLICLIGLGVGYTIYSEWSNLARGAWAYTERMPTLPLFGTGLAPLLQWLLLPPLALRLVARRLQLDVQRS